MPAVPQSRPKPKTWGGKPMDARTSRYHDVYAHWQRNPEVFWAEAAADIDWYEQPKKIFDRDAGIYGRWFTGASLQHLLQRASTATSLAGRGQQAALIYDSPVTNRCRPSPTAACCRRCNCSAPCCATSASPRATASSSICRWCRRRCSPCWPARGSAPSIRWCSAASPPRSSPPASTTPSRRSFCRRAAASRARASFPTSRCSTRRSSSPSTSPTPA